ncbi:MAG: hypothetical protein K0Q66_1436 [Chitinophagaceae bacterium]|jgi:glycosyltransferase involved in cell wall biosynthesis|nr:hypothetical protein [Chitinophagaceae bacterium]
MQDQAAGQQVSRQSGKQPGTAGKRPGIYVYPITPFTYQAGANSYILRVKECLDHEFRVVNSVTRIGILDMLVKLPKTNILYLNWIEDIADKRFGYLQVPALLLTCLSAKLLGIRIAWFIHNDVSHSKKNWRIKKVIRRMMMAFADDVFTHSGELSLRQRLPRIKVFDHPVDEMQPEEAPVAPVYDALVWGAVSPYKGVLEFAKFNHASTSLDGLRILVKGKFISPQFYAQVAAYQKENISFENNMASDEELVELFRQSRCVLFCYQSGSVLSSAALCKTISFGKTVVGPNTGAFKELGTRGLIYTYDNFEQLAEILQRVKSQDAAIDPELIRQYVQQTSWNGFRDFLVANLSARPGRRLLR